MRVIVTGRFVYELVLREERDQPVFVTKDWLQANLERWEEYVKRCCEEGEVVELEN